MEVDVKSYLERLEIRVVYLIQQNSIRNDNENYIYEVFLPTNGFDIKVYTVGEFYAHAEARKSPVLDGKVVRSQNGKEMRSPVCLTMEEKMTAIKIYFLGLNLKHLEIIYYQQFKIGDLIRQIFILYCISCKVFRFICTTKRRDIWKQSKFKNNNFKSSNYIKQQILTAIYHYSNTKENRNRFLQQGFKLEIMTIR